jgi:hypothetical protein
MDQRTNTPPETPAPAAESQPAPPARRPFEPPTLLWSEPFQPVAYGMACGKQPGGGGGCAGAPRLS